MASKKRKAQTIKVPKCTTRYCFLQDEGSTYFPDGKDGEGMSKRKREAFIHENAKYKTDLIFTGADALKVKAQLDALAQEWFEVNSCEDFTYPCYEFDEDQGRLIVKTKKGVFFEDRETESIEQTKVILLDAKTGKPVTDTVGSGSVVSGALRASAYSLPNGTTGITLKPQAFAVYEIKKGGEWKDSEDYWKDYLGIDEEPPGDPDDNEGDAPEGGEGDGSEL